MATEQEEIAIKMIEHAINDKNSEFTKLNNMNEYFVARTVRGATKKVIRGFRDSSKALLAQYLKNIEDGVDDPGFLIEYKKMQKCYEFYKVELSVIRDTITEYENHILSKYFFNAILGYDRRDYE